MYKNLLKALLLGTVLCSGYSFVCMASPDDLPQNSGLIIKRAPVKTPAPAPTTQPASAPVFSELSKLEMPVYVPGSDGSSTYNSVPIKLSAPAVDVKTNLPVTSQTPLSDVKVVGPAQATYAPTPDQKALQLAPAPDPKVYDLGTVTVEATPISAPTVVETRTSEYGAVVQKMSDGSYQYGGSGRDAGQIAHPYDVEAAGFSNAPAPTTFSKEGIPVGQTNMGNGEVTFLEGGSGKQLTPTGDGLFTDGTDTYKVENGMAYKADSKASDAGAQSGDGAKNAPQAQSSGGGSEGASAIDKIAEKIMDPIAIQNVPQYVLLIMEALEGNKQDDATKEVKVKGADPMNDSQGSPTSGATPTMPNTPMSGTTIVDSANAMIALLNMDKIDLSLLSKDIEKAKNETTAGISAQIATSDGKATKTEQKAPTSNSNSESEELTTEERREISHRRALLLGEWAAAATQIGEGSNAISSTFYDRANLFAGVANSAQGSLGGISAITDTDRFVLFEITRGAALSAIQLGLQGAVNLNSLEDVVTYSSDSPDPGISITPGIS